MAASPLSSSGALIFLAALFTQIGAASLLPRTAGFSSLAWTVPCVATYLISVWLVAVLINRGVALSLIIPMFAAAVPLATIAVGYSVYGEPTSVLRLVLLLIACVSVGLAAAIA